MPGILFSLFENDDDDDDDDVPDGSAFGSDSVRTLTFEKTVSYSFLALCSWIKSCKILYWSSASDRDAAMEK